MGSLPSRVQHIASGLAELSDVASVQIDQDYSEASAASGRSQPGQSSPPSSAWSIKVSPKKPRGRSAGSAITIWLNDDDEGWLNFLGARWYFQGARRQQRGGDDELVDLAIGIVRNGVTITGGIVRRTVPLRVVARAASGHRRVARLHVHGDEPAPRFGPVLPFQ